MGFRRVEAAGKRYRIIYRVERAEVEVAIVLAGLRKAGDKRDVYALAKKLLKQGLLRLTPRSRARALDPGSRARSSKRRTRSMG